MIDITPQNAELAAIEALLDRLDPQPDAPCAVAGCVHDHRHAAHGVAGELIAA